MKITTGQLKKIIAEELDNVAEARRDAPRRDDEDYEFGLYKKLVPDEESDEVTQLLYAAGLSDDNEDFSLKMGPRDQTIIQVNMELPKSPAGKKVKAVLDSYPDAPAARSRSGLGPPPKKGAPPKPGSYWDAPAGTPVNLYDRKTGKRVPCTVAHDKKPGVEPIVVLSITMPPDGVLRMRADEAEELARALRGR